MFSKRCPHKIWWKYNCKSHHFSHVCHKVGHTELDKKKKAHEDCILVVFWGQEPVVYINVVQAIAIILGQLQCMSFE
jgi:hypothetical protein